MRKNIKTMSIKRLGIAVGLFIISSCGYSQTELIKKDIGLQLYSIRSLIASHSKPEE